jgi:lipoprotein-releasing system permease protein
MSLKTEFFLAWRYLKPKRNAVSVITSISLIGVILGVAVLIVVLAVMAGFTDKFKEKIIETSAHIQVTDAWTGFISNPEKVIKKAKENGMRAAPLVRKHALVQRGERFIPKVIVGFEPSQDNISIDVSKAILSDNGQILKNGKLVLDKNQILVSDVIASELYISPGDKIIIHSPSKLAKMVQMKPDGEIKMSDKVYIPSEFEVAGIYSMGKYDFDSQVIFMNLEDADELFDLPWGSATSVFIRTEDPFNLNKELNIMREAFPMYQVQTWQQLNSSFLSVLEVEKNMQFFLLIFIVLVAAFSIANTLITVVVQKTREIGLLKALGATDSGVMRIFLMQGFLVGAAGTVFGVITGLTIVHYRNEILRLMRIITHQEIFPKEFYLFSSLPATVHLQDIIIISIISTALCTLGGLIPAWRAAHLAPAKALRYE